ncbi:MAG: hypothetical protein LLG04_07055 [Parachlamydia sp.]|nr:hypothetical protein [Parachlamydia sp.]
MFPIKYIDTAILSLPVMATSAIGAGFSYLAESKNSVQRSIGWFGSRACMVITPLAGLPLLVYSLAKCLFLNLLAKLTFHKYQCLNKWAKEADLHFKVICFAVPTVIVATPYLPQIIRGAVKTYRTYQNYEPVIKRTVEQIKVFYNQVKRDFNQLIQRLNERRPHLVVPEVVLTP